MSKLQAGPIPLYYQIQEDLLAQIRSGKLAPGDMLMTEDELCRKYSVSRITVRKALDKLEDQELIHRKRGLGTFVAQPSKSFRYHGSLEDTLAANGDAKVFLVDRWAKPSPYVAGELKTEPGERIRHFEILLLEQGNAFAHMQYFLPGRFGKQIDQADIESIGSFSRAVETKTGHVISRAEQAIEPVLADRDMARHLDLAPKTALLRLLRTYFDQANVPTHVAIVHCHPHRYRYRVELLAKPRLVR